MKKTFQRAISLGVLLLSVLALLPTPDISQVTFAAAGDWKPDSNTLFGNAFPHAFGVSRSTNENVRPDNADTSTTPFRIRPSDIAAGNVYTCDINDPNNHLDEANNNHYYPDGLPYASFNNYRNEWTNDSDNPPLTYFDSNNSNSEIAGEVERNYVGGALFHPTPQTVIGTNSAKDLVTLDNSSLAGGSDLYMLAYVHNNGSTALNPTTSDPRATTAIPGQTATMNLSTRATNTRTHFSVPSLALPTGGAQATVVNRLRADNAYTIDLQIPGNPCANLIQTQISDISRIRNNSSTPLTFVVRSGYIQNQYITDSNNPNFQSDFSATALHQLVDPRLSQSYVSGQSSIAHISGTEGARISSGRSATVALRNVPNQRFTSGSGCDPSITANQANVNCNAFAAPVRSGEEFDGEWYGSTEFQRYVGINLDAVEAVPEISVSKSVRRLTTNEQQFTTSGPTTTTIQGSGDGEVEYQVVLQNTGNVDLNDINFGDLLQPGLEPTFSGPGQMVGEIARCSNIAITYATDFISLCTPVASSVPVRQEDGNYVVLLDSATLGVSTSTPLYRDSRYITSGLSSHDDGQTIRIRWRMNSVCSAEDTPPQINNYGVITAASNGIQAQVVSINNTNFPQFITQSNISQNDWAAYFPNGTSLIPQFNFSTNLTTVTLNQCATPGNPELRIGKYVRRVAPAPAQSFGTGSVLADLSQGTGSGTVEYSVLIQNSGTTDITTIAFADILPAELAFVSGSIRTEICANITDARADANCPGSTLGTLPDSVYNSSTRTIALDPSNGIPIAVELPLESGQIVRIRWNMTSVCTPYGTNPTPARNYALVAGGLLVPATEDTPRQITNATVAVFPGVTAEPGTPVGTYNISRTTFTSLFPTVTPSPFPGLYGSPTNNTTVVRNNCAMPPPTVTKQVSSTVRDSTTTTPTNFVEADTTGAAVAFGQRDAQYTVYYRVSVTNNGNGTITDQILQDRFYFRNGDVVTAQDVVESIGSQLNTYTVNSSGVETALTNTARRVYYVSNNVPSANILRFRIPTIQPNETISFYYSIRVSPGTRVASQYHRNEVEICWPQTTPTGACTDGGRNVAYHQDTPGLNPLQLNIIKTVNGQDANDASLTGAQAAVQVVNGQALHYVVTVTAPSTNDAPVTGIVLTDTVTTLPNVTGITNIQLRTTGTTCPIACAIASMSALASRAGFDLAPGQQAILTYDAVASYTTNGTFNRNIARATPTSTNPRNPTYREDPATVIVRNSAITILKTVNGQDADTDATAVTVNSGVDLNYVITISAPAGNASTVTAIVLTDDVTTLPNVTNIRTIRLTTPGAPCATPCSLTSISDLASRAFDLAAGQSATLTYTATSTNTGTALSARNRNTARATPATTATNPGPVENPATVFVRGTTTPRTDFRITKEANPEVVRDGDEVTYTILVEPRNSRNDEIANLVLLITDDINDTGRLEQGGVTFTYIRGSTRIRTDDADCENEMNDEDGIRCEEVSAEDEIRITYRVRVSAPNLSGSDIVVVDNTAVLRSDTPGVRIRDEDDAEVQVIAPPAPPEQERPIGITKNVDRREVKRGEIANYTITVHNPNDHEIVRTLVDTIGLNAGTVPGQNGGRVRFNQGSLQLSGAQFSGSIDRPEGMVLVIPANGLVTITYTATGEPDAGQRQISLAPNTATLNTGEYATAFVELPKTGPVAMGMTALSSVLVSGVYFVTRRRKKSKS